MGYRSVPSIVDPTKMDFTGIAILHTGKNADDGVLEVWAVGSSQISCDAAVALWKHDNADTIKTPEALSFSWYGWLFGRLNSHIRNLIDAELTRQKRGLCPAQGNISDLGDPLYCESPDPASVPQSRPDEDWVDAVCQELPPRASSVVRRLVAGQLVPDIAEALGISEAHVQKIARRVKELVT